MQPKPFSWLNLIFLALPVLAIVLVSGCTTGQTTGGSGVVVKEFAPEFTEIYAGEPVTFRLLVKNEGSIDAINGHAELLGLDEDWCGSQMDKCTTSQGGRPEMLPNEELCRYTYSKGFKLLAPDPQRGTQGGTQICTWTYKAPPIQQGFTIPYTPTVRTFYSYKSGAVKLITFGPSRELRTIQDTGGKLPTETKSQTSSPIMLDIQTQGPIRFWPEEKAVVFPLEITIKNVGGGVACADEKLNYVEKSSKDNKCRALAAGEVSKNRVKIKINFGSDSSNTKMELSQECKDFKDGKLVSLWKGQSNSVVCDVTALGLVSENTIQRMITAEAVYDYYTDISSSITVIGRKQIGDINQQPFTPPSWRDPWGNEP
ncbi:MAG: hypothetical protein MUP55_01290 [Candidatus Aenigmarchaeota archaeon]|nr:hypothetical protein [Candidatus Aenigmarchaeota archaeon]